MNLINIVSIFTIFLTFHIAKTQNVTRGSSLTPTGATTSWLSPSGLYAFGFYPQTGGYAVGIYVAGIPERTVVWTASRDILPISHNATLRFRDDGRLTLDGTQGQEIIISDVSGASFASMQDNGNFVLYEGTTVLWQSFDNPTDTLLAGQRLANGQTLISSLSETDQSLGIFRLKMQTDGHLVQYPNIQETPDSGSYAYWASGTAGNGPNVTLNLDSGGFLYLLKNSTFLIRNLTQGGYPRDRAIYRMKIDVDGIFRLYYHNLSNMDKNGSVIWASSDNMCTAKGHCGVNGYCSVMNNAARCQCLPGFEFVNPDIWRLGCKRNSIVENCKIVDAGTAFNMTLLYNARWEGDPYAIPEAPTQQDCSLACLNDCNCEVALFTERQCKLQKLPIRFIEVVQSESNYYNSTAFIKVHSARTPSLSTSPTAQKRKNRVAKVLGPAIGISLIVVVGFVMFTVHKKRQYIETEEEEEYFAQVPGMPTRFSYDELKAATRNFSKKLGEGGFGTVFEGVLEDGSKIAVKCLEGLGQVNKSFLAEIESIGSIHHVNLVRLRGYSAWKSRRLLVYEFMSNGSLDRWIYHGDLGHVLVWKCRKHIILHIAKGLAYLHEDCRQQIIHLDIKPQNILLDDNFNAKVSDFGLSKLVDKNQTQVMTTIKGTPGYIAPECWISSIITEKVDVYSFGIVVLEILCGRKIFDRSLPEESWHLLGVFQKSWEQGTLLDMVDKYNEDMQANGAEVVEMMKVASWCLQTEFTRRPSMSLVVKVLEGAMSVESNLDYNFTDYLSMQKTTIAQEKELTQLMPSIISGPR